MSLDLASLVSNKATATVEYQGAEAKVVYKPGLITQKTIAQMDEGDDGAVEFVLAIVSSWDVMNAKKKVPLTKTALDALPIPFVRAVVLGILRDRGDEAGEAGKN